MNPDSVWQLRLDVVWVLILLGVARCGRAGEPKPEVHAYLGDRYWRLGDYHARRGAKQKAARLRVKAKQHLRLGGGWDPSLPPAAAMRMPVPQRPTFTAAVGWRSREGPPDDAA